MTPSSVGDPQRQLLGLRRRGPGSSPGAGASTCTHWPSACTVSTTGQAAACPNGERATSAASSRRIGTARSTINGVPAASSSATSSGSGAVEHPHAAPVVAAADRLEHHRPAVLGAEPLRRRAGSRTAANAGTASPSPASRSRITSLSWACSSAAGAGCTGDPGRDQRAQVLLRHLLVVEGDRGAAAGEGAQRGQVGRRRRDTRPAHTSAAGSPGSAASTRSDWPSAIAAWWVIRASWPAPIMPTTGRRASGSGAFTGGRPYRCAVASIGSGTIDQVTFVESALAAIPEPYRGVAIKHRELVKFALVGGTTWVIDTTVFLLLKTTVLDTKPLTAKIIAVLVATIVVLRAQPGVVVPDPRRAGAAPRGRAVLRDQRDRGGGVHARRWRSPATCWT